jgi:hypothetical protein
VEPVKLIVTASLVAVAAGLVVPATHAAGPLAVRAGFDQANVQFGDIVEARVGVVVDPALVRPSSVRVSTDLAPLTPESPSRTSRTGDVIEVTSTVACISQQCVAPGGDTTPALAPVVVTAVGRDGRRIRATAAWQPLHVRGRVSAADMRRDTLPFRADTTPAAPTYRIAPSTLEWLLDAAAILLLLGALALVVAQLRSARRRRAPARGDELARALRLAHEAEDRSPTDRRKALGLLSRLLGSRDRTLAESANELAWARPEPDREEVAGLVGDVEREIVS